VSFYTVDRTRARRPPSGLLGAPGQTASLVGSSSSESLTSGGGPSPSESLSDALKSGGGPSSPSSTIRSSSSTRAASKESTLVGSRTGSFAGACARSFGEAFCSGGGRQPGRSETRSAERAWTFSMVQAHTDGRV
jgi:hypothetical protein